MDLFTLWDLPGIDGKHAARTAAEMDMSGRPRPQRLAAMLSALDPAAPLGIDAAIELLAEDRRCAVDSGDTTYNSALTRLRDIREGFAWAKFEGASTVDSAAELMQQWVTSPDLGRDGRLQPVSVATQHRRRSAVRFAYARLRRFGLTSHYPTVDLEVRDRPDCPAPLLSDSEVARVQWVAEQRLNSVQPIAYALSCAGVTAGEIGFVTPMDINADEQTVWAGGSTKARPRLLSIPEPQWALVAARLQDRIDLTVSGTSPLAYGGNSSAEHVRSSMVSKAIASLGVSSGIHLTIGRLNAWAVRRRFDAFGRIEDAATLLGVSSLDTAARVIHHQWAVVP